MAISDVPEPAPGAPAAPDPNLDQSSSIGSSQPANETLTTTEEPIVKPWPEPLVMRPQLVIRPYHPSDAAHIAKIANNKNITRHMTNRFPDPYTLEDSEAFIAKALDPNTSGVYAWTASLTPTSEPIGGCGLEPGRDVYCRNAEIGYWLGEEYWGKGYATVMCEALTDWAFSLEKGLTGENALQRLGAGVFGGNVGSGKVLAKCGYTHEGTMRGIVWKWGEVRDVQIWGLRREEWEERRKKKEEEEVSVS